MNNTSSYQPYKGPKLAPTPFSDPLHAGVNLDLQEHSSLASHEDFHLPLAPTRNIYRRRDTQSVESPTILRDAPASFTRGRDPKNTPLNQIGTITPTQTGTNDSPFSSEADIHPSSGVPLDQFGSTMPTATLPQHANFSQLAEHQGIHDWNNSVFDDRWLLQPEEIWNLEARRDSAITVSPESLAPSRNNIRTFDQTGSSHAESQRISDLSTHTQRTGREGEEKEKENCSRHVATAPTEPRRTDGREALGTSGMLATRKGSHTDQ